MSNPAPTGRWPWEPQPAAVSKRRRRRRMLLPLLVACLAAGWCAYFYDYVREWNARPGPKTSLLARESRQALVDIAFASAKRLVAPLLPDPTPTLHLEIEPRHFARIMEKRSEALERRFLITHPDDFVPATLRHGGRTVRVRVRLKGDLTDHLEGDKWSFRVEVRGGEHVLGMRRFSLQAPHTRGHQAEPLFFDFLREHGVLAPRFFFVDLELNNRRIGRMALEEHFSTELLESQQRRDGLIVRFDEQYFYRAELEFFDLVPDYDNWRNVPVDAFRSGRIASSQSLTEQLRIARGLLRGLADETLAPSEVFDARLLGRFLAACEVWSTPHMAHWNNLRFYLNPITLQLEPVGFDSTGEVMDIPPLRCSGFTKAMMTHAVLDPVVQREVLDSLRTMRAEVTDPAFPKWLRDREARYLPALQRDLPWLRPFPAKPLQLRASELASVHDEETFERYLIPQPKREMPHRATANYPNIVQATLYTDGTLELANGISLPLTVTELWIETVDPRDPEGSPTRTTQPAYVSLPATHWPEIPHRARAPLPFALPASDGFRVGGRALLGDRHHEFVAVAGAPALEEPPLPRAFLAETLALHPYLERDAEGWLRIGPGIHLVNQSLVLPEGVGLRLAAGTTLRFAPDAMLLARGPLSFAGSVDEEIVLEPQRDVWPGIVVLGRDDAVHWSHVVVRATVGPEIPGWGVTGGVTLRRADVELEHTTFAGSGAEDALNTIRSALKLRDVSFHDAASDAFDADFCTGALERGKFRDVNGDGLDVSGSEMRVVDTQFVGIRDKAISVGEASSVTILSLRVRDSGTGVASKDGSTADVQGGSIEGSGIAALMAYVKKDEYGPATLLARDLAIAGSGRNAVAQTGSRIVIDDREVSTEPVDVEALYRSSSMRK